MRVLRVTVTGETARHEGAAQATGPAGKLPGT